jgi:hypothetical protein
MKLTTLERTITIIQFSLFLFIFFFTVDSLITTIRFWENPPYYGGQKVTNALLFRTYHFNILFSVISIFSSIGLLLQKRWGWVASIIVWFTSGITTIIMIVQLVLKKPYWDMTMTEIIFSSFLALFFFAIGCLLITTRFKEKYKLTSSTIKVIITVIVFLILDKLLIYR